MVNVNSYNYNVKKRYAANYVSGSSCAADKYAAKKAILAYYIIHIPEQDEVSSRREE